MTIDFGAVVTLGLAVIGAIVWFVKLESSIKAVDKRVDVTNDRVGVTEVQINEMNSSVVKELAKLREEFAELRGWLKAIKIQKED